METVKDITELITDGPLFASLCNDWKYDKDVVLPTKPYKGNCTKEFCDRLVEMYIDREFDRIQDWDFPSTMSKEITLKECSNEFDKLKTSDVNFKTPSKIVKHFHKSMCMASVGKGKSPYEGWKEMKNNKEVFRKFYANRLRCSDWFKEKDNWKYLLVGYVPEFIYGIGLSTSRMFQFVTYFKPSLAKYIVTKYLGEYKSVFDPFSGYSGRMLGVLSTGREYIGQDLCELSVKESNEIYNFIKGNGTNALFGDTPNVPNCTLSVKDCLESKGEYECLLTCSPYGDIENWPDVPRTTMGCDKWIDVCLENFTCGRYVFVTDGNIIKYKSYVKEQIINTSHLAENMEYIVVIDKNERDEIIKGDVRTNDVVFDTCATPYKITMKGRSKTFGKMGIDMFNIFNSKVFASNIAIPEHFEQFVCDIYGKFGFAKPNMTAIPYKTITLKENDKVVVLAFSGGLDSCSRALSLMDMGYEVHLFHMANANRYEQGLATKCCEEFANKFNMPLFIAKLSNGDKAYPENPIKNQMILGAMVDYCIDNDFNQIAVGEFLELTLDETTMGVNVTDARCVTLDYIQSLKHIIPNLVFLDAEKHLSKLDKLRILNDNDAIDLYYSCLTQGKFNNMRHKECERTYHISLQKHNCGCYCRKCATHNLLLHYGGVKNYPMEFVDKCWKIMYDNSYSSEYRFFAPDIPLETRIENLYLQ